MIYIESQHPELWASISHPPNFVEALCEHTSETTGWSTVGRSAGVHSLWQFWKSALDVEHLKSLMAKPILPKIDPVASVGNKFDAQSVEDEVRPKLVETVKDEE